LIWADASSMTATKKQNLCFDYGFIIPKAFKKAKQEIADLNKKKDAIH
jgi:hypothetical protein